MSTIICPNCRIKNDSDSSFCENCGWLLEGLPISDTEKDETPSPDRQEPGIDEAETAVPLSSRQPTSTSEDEKGNEPVENLAGDEDDLNDWLRGLPPPTTGELGTRRDHAEEDSGLPTWLQEVRATTGEQIPDGEPRAGDWPSGDDQAGSVPVKPAQTGEELPDWVADITGEEQRTMPVEPTAADEWYGDIDVSGSEPLPQTAELPMTEPLDPSKELDGIPEQLAGEALPGWLLMEAGADEAPVSADYRSEGREPVEWKTTEQPTPSDVSSDQDDRFSQQDGLMEEQPATGEIDGLVDGTLSSDQIAAEDPSDWLEEIGVPAAEPSFDEPLLPVTPVSDVTGADANLDETYLSQEPVVGDNELDTGSDETHLQDESLVDLSGSPSADFLDYLEDAPGPALSEPFPEPELRADLEPEAAEIPGWLKAVKPTGSAESDAEPVQGAREVTGPLTGFRGVIPVAAAATGAGQVAEPARFEMTKEQQQQVALLEQLTFALPEHTPVEIGSSEINSYLSERLVLGILLVLVILLSWFLPIDSWFPFLTSWSVPESASAVYQAIEEVGGGTTLVAFEYTPAMAGELDVIADSVLAQLAGNDSSVLTVSQAAAGVMMARQALERSDIQTSYDLGFLPGEAVGLRGLGSCLEALGGCNSMAGLPIDVDAELLLKNVGLIIVLTGDRDSMVNWIEQVSVQTETPMAAGLTQSLVPVSAPYTASEQLVGIIEGAPASAIYEYSQEPPSNQSGDLLISLTMAQWLVIGVMVIGALYFGLVKWSGKMASNLGGR